MTSATALTPARRRGLAALVLAHPGACWISNATSVEYGDVYWQTARWLVAEGLAIETPAFGYVRLSFAGAELADALGLVPAA